MKLSSLIAVTVDDDKLEIGIEVGDGVFTEEVIPVLKEEISRMSIPKFGSITHHVCGGCVDFRQTTLTKSTFSCRACNFRLNVPVDLTTVQHLQTHFSYLNNVFRFSAINSRDVIAMSKDIAAALKKEFSS